jgi:hypothetical protein
MATTKKKKKAVKSAHARLKSGRLSAKGLACLCGCAETTSDTAKFLVGHDVRLKTILKGVAAEETSSSKIPRIAIPFLVEEGICGFTGVKDGKTITVTAAE